MIIREGLRWRGSSTDGSAGDGGNGAVDPRAPPVALLSLALGVLVAAHELWPIVTAWSSA